MNYEIIKNLETPVIDKLLQIHTLKTKEGVIINETLTKGQKVIMECIITRKSPTPEQLNRIHIECITRYGKSMCIGAALAIRVNAKGDPWAVVAPTQDKAQIILDYAVQFATNDPIMRANLILSQPDKDAIDKLKEHRSRDHITFKRGGEIRAFSAGQKSTSNKSSGDALMGFGCKNVVEDECYLIDDQTHSKVLRMLGDSPFDNFIIKIGNPWNRGHGYDSRNDPNYFKVIIDHTVALDEGRLSPQFLEEMRNKPNFGVLYECLPPEADAMDSDGYYPLFNERLIKAAIIGKDVIKGFGKRRSGVDISDGGDNESVIADRWENVARITMSFRGRALDFVTHVGLQCETSNEINMDGNGVGSTPTEILRRNPYIGERIHSIMVGMPSTEPEKFANIRAEIYWKAKLWIEQGGKLEAHPMWDQLLLVKYRVNEKGQIIIISKDKLRSMGISSPDYADAFSLTFAPEPPNVTMMQGGGFRQKANPYSDF